MRGIRKFLFKFETFLRQEENMFSCHWRRMLTFLLTQSGNFILLRETLEEEGNFIQI